MQCKSLYKPSLTQAELMWGNRIRMRRFVSAIYCGVGSRDVICPRHAGTIRQRFGGLARDAENAIRVYGGRLAWP
jgi:hypothetical protein